MANLQALWQQLPGDQRMGRHGGPGIVVELLVSNAVSNLLLREADIALRMVQPDQGSLIAQRTAGTSPGGVLFLAGGQARAITMGA